MIFLDKIWKNLSNFFRVLLAYAPLGNVNRNGKGDDSQKNNPINHLFHHPGDNIRIICNISPDLTELDTITLRHNGNVMLNNIL